LFDDRDLNFNLPILPEPAAMIPDVEDDMFEDGDLTFNLPVLPEPAAMVPDPTEGQNLSFESISISMSEVGSSSGTAGRSSGTAIVIPENPQAAPVEPADAGRRRSQLALQVCL
jgi:hypothetical protein